MAIDHVFRSTPQLGPGLTDHDTSFWFLPAGTYDKDGSTPLDDKPGVSYQLGNPEYGTDGHLYVMVVAGAGFSAGDGLSINETTWVASADASDPEWEVPDDVKGGSVPNGAYFHARKVAL